MSQRLATFCAVDYTAFSAPARWQLERAGIINVYQYGNEVLEFAGGRLLLRGVNGSGKSTAMNMLLPFLLTASQRNIDAAQDQRGLLLSWMLGGRDDAQPVGYLWIEFRSGNEFITCGCGIKANRQANNVTTWWFATPKRPDFDFDFVEDNVALSAEVLRDRLGGDPVFRERDRREYRRLIEQRLFGGASLDQHIRLIDKVRNPRVGDRIDRDLPYDLMDALPQLSEKALTDAAAPLDDLDEHRRNVAALERTVSALSGLLGRYRAYCAGDLRTRVAEGRRLLRDVQRCHRNEANLRSEATEAEAKVQRIEGQIGEEARRADRLRSQISAIEESRAYQEGRQLDAMRDLVERLRRDVRDAQRQAELAVDRIRRMTDDLTSAQRRSDDDLGHLNGSLSEATRLAVRCGLAQRPPPALELCRTAMEDVDAAVPGQFDATTATRRLNEVVAAVLQRRKDIELVGVAHDRLDEAETRLTRAQDALKVADDAHRQASERRSLRDRSLVEAMQGWVDGVREWATESERLCGAAGSPTGVAAEAVELRPSSLEVRDELRASLLAEIEAAVALQHDVASATQHRLHEVSEAAEAQQATLDDLLSRAEPRPPRLSWQSPSAYCLADVIDFADAVGASERVGLEAALEASGLLSARPVPEEGAFKLATGELVAIATARAERPLSMLLDVSVPAHLAGQADEDLVARLLESVTCELRSDVSSHADREVDRHANGISFIAVGTDGSFRLGTLAGRHRKEQAEYIGAAARLEALSRARAAARVDLGRIRAEESRLGGLLADQRSFLDRLRVHRTALPPTAALERAEGAAETAAGELAETQSRREAAISEATEAERAVSGAETELHRVATTHALPSDRSSLGEVVAGMGELDRHLAECNSRLTTLQRSVDEWGRGAEQTRAALGEHDEVNRRLSSTEAEREREQARLDMLTKTVGVEYERVRSERDRLASELGTLDEGLPQLRREQASALEDRAHRRAESASAVRETAAAQDCCESFRRDLHDVLATPGYVGALDGDAATVAATETVGGSDGLAVLLGCAEEIAGETESAGSRPQADGVSADSVIQSLQQRRDALGRGWDAQVFLPDPSRPLRIEVSGPPGRATLAGAHQRAAVQLRELAGLLDRKQQDALRELLQGLIATEIAQKMHGAKHMVELMNHRLASVATAHRVGVRLRWRRSPELDAATSRMVGLLAKQPDLRTPEENEAVRQALSERLAEARSSEPDAAYRELIAQTLDYKQWHNMDVMVTRPEAPESRLSRRTPLSEGEKKLVTYLPLFVAVAASYDAMAEANSQSYSDRAAIARFVLLDDAFAKVSADNHAALFGLLVALDLDFIATSERLWGHHASLPELSIVEIVRDPTLQTILLDRFSWRGQSRERAGAS